MLRRKRVRESERRRSLGHCAKTSGHHASASNGMQKRQRHPISGEIRRENWKFNLRAVWRSMVGSIQFLFFVSWKTNKMLQSFYRTRSVYSPKKLGEELSFTRQHRTKGTNKFPIDNKVLTFQYLRIWRKYSRWLGNIQISSEGGWDRISWGALAARNKKNWIISAKKEASQTPLMRCYGSSACFKNHRLTCIHHTLRIRPNSFKVWTYYRRCRLNIFDCTV